MFVGHEFLAFALAGWGALGVGRDDRTALNAGVVAAVAALLPDFDVGYAAATYAVAVAGGTPLGWETFWGVANATHRVATHPLPTGVVATLVLGAAVAGSRGQRSAPGGRSRPRSERIARVALAGSAVVGSAVLLWGFRTVVSPAAAAVAGGFLACVAVAGWLLATRTALSLSGTIAAAGVGFLSHPFGDTLLAAPPPLLSPFGPPVWTGRVSLAADPTLDIVSVLFAELAAVWAGLVVFSRVAGHRTDIGGRLRDALDRRAGVGLAYAPAAGLLPRPTIVDAHVLGATIVPFAAVVGVWVGYTSFPRGVAVAHADADARRTGAVYTGVVAGVTALTLASVAYTVVYALV
ncbi:hypothetical protein GCM10008995_13650 [Halobellus salinus]|uniref:Hydrolase n=1 Tax=Halobellus salinus TaxID=931585 RepID=A0A830EMF0_9EURY|nr:metal-dependent hydrolase [Halobellus salinus]GGJ05106.1 hypothetical protein GCM10008995_13650 [Halobellus salinus]SMP22920.1 LexA-binding, inner membrane-associated putative hydrolase [Halobellus salinus]